LALSFSLARYLAIKLEKERKILVIYSDMRNSTSELNLELATGSKPRLTGIKPKLPVADLHGVEIFVLGGNGLGESIAEWQNAQQFWREYFLNAHATLTRYSELRDTQEF
jgi:hypothetical protein